MYGDYVCDIQEGRYSNKNKISNTEDNNTEEVIGE